MYVQVRMMDTGVSVIITTSRTTDIETFKKLVEEKFHIKPENQRLFFAGKQLENQHSLFDYGININDVIQLMVKAVIIENIDKTETAIPSSSSVSTSNNNDIEDILEESKYFKIGDNVDVKDNDYGSWFVGKLIKIKKNTSLEEKQKSHINLIENDGLIYVVEFIGCPDEKPIEVQLPEIRPHAFEILPINELKSGDHVLMNYNVDYPRERGYWYDTIIKTIKFSRKGYTVLGDIVIGRQNTMLNNCQLIFLDDIYKIKLYQLLSERTQDDDYIMQTQSTITRAGPLNCIECKDNSSILCKDCGCSICGLKDNDDQQLLCDECNSAYHLTCLTPPLEKVPEDDWYCSLCKNNENEIVKAGEKLKVSKKKSIASTSKRDWGNGMACVGRTKKCNIVPLHHFGPIPGVEVGSSWMFRVQVSEAGVHRPPVGGIHGRADQGAFSIILSGGYEDDVDNGDEFLYTGSGGRDLSGNKRTALQSCDQDLVRLNKALALNCNAVFDGKNGATAVDWRKGKPVRTVRNYKLAKHSKYAPKVGNRYDGIYKVVKYYPESGKSGFNVWRFVLRRDDPIPAPWTKKGKERIAELGLELIYPQNYVPPPLKTKELKTKLSKRKLLELDQDHKDDDNKSYLSLVNDNVNKELKKQKIQYELENNVEKLIKADVINQKYWNDCKEMLRDGKKTFLDRVAEVFLCICCQEIVFEPITTKCSHNICKGCLKRSFNAEVFQCPTCRGELGKGYSMNINNNLEKILLLLFPGYTSDR